MWRTCSPGPRCAHICSSITGVCFLRARALFLKVNYFTGSPDPDPNPDLELDPYSKPNPTLTHSITDRWDDSGVWGLSMSETEKSHLRMSQIEMSINAASDINNLLSTQKSVHVKIELIYCWHPAINLHLMTVRKQKRVCERHLLLGVHRSLSIQSEDGKPLSCWACLLNDW